MPVDWSKYSPDPPSPSMGGSPPPSAPRPKTGGVDWSKYSVAPDSISPQPQAAPPMEPSRVASPPRVAPGAAPSSEPTLDPGRYEAPGGVETTIHAPVPLKQAQEAAQTLREGIPEAQQPEKEPKKRRGVIPRAISAAKQAGKTLVAGASEFGAARLYGETATAPDWMDPVLEKSAAFVENLAPESWREEAQSLQERPITDVPSFFHAMWYGGLYNAPLMVDSAVESEIGRSVGALTGGIVGGKAAGPTGAKVGAVVGRSGGGVLGGWNAMAKAEMGNYKKQYLPMLLDAGMPPDQAEALVDKYANLYGWPSGLIEHASNAFQIAAMTKGLRAPKTMLRRMALKKLATTPMWKHLAAPFGGGASEFGEEAAQHGLEGVVARRMFEEASRITGRPLSAPDTGSILQAGLKGGAVGLGYGMLGIPGNVRGTQQSRVYLTDLFERTRSYGKRREIAQQAFDEALNEVEAARAQATLDALMTDAESLLQETQHDPDEALRSDPTLSRYADLRDEGYDDVQAWQIVDSERQAQDREERQIEDALADEVRRNADIEAQAIEMDMEAAGVSLPQGRATSPADALSSDPKTAAVADAENQDALVRVIEAGTDRVLQTPTPETTDEQDIPQAQVTEQPIQAPEARLQEGAPEGAGAGAGVSVGLDRARSSMTEPSDSTGEVAGQSPAVPDTYEPMPLMTVKERRQYESQAEERLDGDEQGLKRLAAAKRAHQDIRREIEEATTNGERLRLESELREVENTLEELATGEAIPYKPPIVTAEQQARLDEDEAARQRAENDMAQGQPVSVSDVRGDVALESGLRLAGYTREGEQYVPPPSTPPGEQAPTGRGSISELSARIDAVPPKADGSVDMEARQRVLDEWKAANQEAVRAVEGRLPPTRRIQTQSNGYQVPILLSDEPSGRFVPTVEIGDGVITIHPEKPSPGGSLRNRYFRYVDEAIQPLGENIFVRMTNHPDDYKHVAERTHRGSLARNQKFDFESPEEEGGLSVAYTEEFPADYGYLLTGTVIGQDADGAPLLDTATAKPLTELLTLKRLRSVIDKRVEKRLSKLGLPLDFYRGRRTYLKESEYRKVLQKSPTPLTLTPEGRLAGAEAPSEASPASPLRGSRTTEKPSGSQTAETEPQSDLRVTGEPQASAEPTESVGKKQKPKRRAVPKARKKATTSPEAAKIQTIAGNISLSEFERTDGYQPWEVTQQDWVNLQRAERRRLGQPEEDGTRAAPEQFHAQSVKEAVNAGEDVDERVLADYPDLAPKPAPSPEASATQMPKGVKPTDRAFGATWDDVDGENRVSGVMYSQRHGQTFAEADAIARELGGWVMAFDEDGQLVEVASYSPEAAALKVGDRIPWKNSPDPNEDVREIEVVKLTPTFATVRWVGGTDLQKLPRAAVEARLAEQTPSPEASAPGTLKSETEPTDNTRRGRPPVGELTPERRVAEVRKGVPEVLWSTTTSLGNRQYIRWDGSKFLETDITGKERKIDREFVAMAIQASENVFGGQRQQPVTPPGRPPAGETLTSSKRLQSLYNKARTANNALERAVKQGADNDRIDSLQEAYREIDAQIKALEAEERATPPGRGGVGDALSRINTGEYDGRDIETALTQPSDARRDQRYALPSSQKRGRDADGRRRKALAEASAADIAIRESGPEVDGGFAETAIFKAIERLGNAHGLSIVPIAWDSSRQGFHRGSVVGIVNGESPAMYGIHEIVHDAARKKAQPIIALMDAVNTESSFVEMYHSALIEAEDSWVIAAAMEAAGSDNVDEVEAHAKRIVAEEIVANFVSGDNFMREAFTDQGEASRLRASAIGYIMDPGRGGVGETAETTEQPRKRVAVPSKKATAAAPAPQVAQPLVKGQDSVVVTYPSGKQETLKGKAYYLPGFEEYGFVMVKPRGNKAKATKQGWTLYEKTTGKRIYGGTVGRNQQTEQDVLNQVMRMLRATGKAGLDKAIASQSAPAPKKAIPTPKKTDPNIGRTWNSPYGPQRIDKRIVSNAGDMYSVLSEDGAERRYKVEDIERTIQQDEYRLTPAYEEEKASYKRAAERRQAERDAEAAERAEIDAFTASAGMTPMQAGRARKSLMLEMRFNRDPKPRTRKNYIESQVADGATVMRDGSVGPRLETPDGTFMTQADLTKAGLQYAEYLIAQRQVETTAEKPAPKRAMPQPKSAKGVTAATEKKYIGYLIPFTANELNEVTTVGIERAVDETVPKRTHKAFLEWALTRPEFSDYTKQRLREIYPQHLGYGDQQAETAPAAESTASQEVFPGDDIRFDTGGQANLRATVMSVSEDSVRVDTGFTQRDVNRSEIKEVIPSVFRKAREENEAARKRIKAERKAMAASTDTPAGQTVTSPKGEAEAERKALTPKEQKKYLLAEIDAAIENAPADPVSTGKGKFESVTIEVPDDGTFTIENHKAALETFRKAAKSKFPASVPKRTGIPRSTAKGQNSERVSQGVSDALRLYGNPREAVRRLTAQIEAAEKAPADYDDLGEARETLIELSGLKYTAKPKSEKSKKYTLRGVRLEHAERITGKEATTRKLSYGGGVDTYVGGLSQSDLVTLERAGWPVEVLKAIDSTADDAATESLRTEAAESAPATSPSEQPAEKPKRRAVPKAKAKGEAELRQNRINTGDYNASDIEQAIQDGSGRQDQGAVGDESRWDADSRVTEALTAIERERVQPRRGEGAGGVGAAGEGGVQAAGRFVIDRTFGMSPAFRGIESVAARHGLIAVPLEDNGQGGFARGDVIGITNRPEAVPYGIHEIAHALARRGDSAVVAVIDAIDTTSKQFGFYASIVMDNEASASRHIKNAAILSGNPDETSLDVLKPYLDRMIAEEIAVDSISGLEGNDYFASSADPKALRSAAMKAILNPPKRRAVPKAKKRPPIPRKAGDKGEALPSTVDQSKIEDFGEKLGGARKDVVMSANRDMTDDYIRSQPLSKIWPKSEVDAIEDEQVASVAHAVRSEIPHKPRRGYKLNRWVDSVKTLREIMRLTNDMGYDRVMGLMRSDRYNLARLADKIEFMQGIDRAQWGRIDRVENHPNAYRFDDDGNKVQAPYATAKVDGKYIRADNLDDLKDAVQESVSETKGKKAMQFQVRRNRRTKEVFINKKGDSLYRPLKTFTGDDAANEALAYIRENRADLEQAWEDLKERQNVKETDLRRGENRPRTGADHRAGRDATPEMFMDSFGFRGVEFGNWVSQGKNQKERQGMLNAAYDALMDLSSIIGVPPRAMSLNGTLGLGLGSRGRGWASAHYEPSTLVIALTKTRGAGSLAHEWFHALDNYFQRKRGVAREDIDEMFITHQPETRYRHETGGSISEARYNELKERNLLRDADKWTKVEGVRPEVEEAFTTLVSALDDSPMAQRSRAVDASRSKKYWSQTLERAARAFENYVIAKMQQQGYDNDYLANVVTLEEFSREDDRYPYLLPEELAPVEDAFDALFGTVETRETESGVELFSMQDQRALDKRPQLPLKGEDHEQTQRERDTTQPGRTGPRDDEAGAGAKWTAHRERHLARPGLNPALRAAYEQAELDADYANTPEANEFTGRVKRLGFDVIYVKGAGDLEGRWLGSERLIVVNTSAIYPTREGEAHEEFHVRIFIGDPLARLLLQAIDRNSDAVQAYHQALKDDFGIDQTIEDTAQDVAADLFAGRTTRHGVDLTAAIASGMSETFMDLAERARSDEMFSMQQSERGPPTSTPDQDARFRELTKTWTPGGESMPPLTSVNPTGGVFSDYMPQERATAPLGENITTLDVTSGKSPTDTVTIYRGAPSTQSEIVPGDYVTTNKRLAQDYAGNGKVLSKTVSMRDVLDDRSEPLGEEYIYRPSANIPAAWAAWKAAHPTEYADLEKMRADVLKAQGYTVGPVWHGTKAQFTVFHSFSHFGTEEAADRRLQALRGEEEMPDGYPVDEIVYKTAWEPDDRMVKAYLRPGKTLVTVDTGGDTFAVDLLHEAMAAEVIGQREGRILEERIDDGDIDAIDEIAKAMRDKGYLGFEYENTVEDPGNISYIVADSSQIKSAEVAPDDTGRIPPPSEWGDAGTDDIRYGDLQQGAENEGIASSRGDIPGNDNRGSRERDAVWVQNRAGWERQLERVIADESSRDGGNRVVKAGLRVDRGTAESTEFRRAERVFKRYGYQVVPATGSVPWFVSHRTKTVVATSGDAGIGIVEHELSHILNVQGDPQITGLVSRVRQNTALVRQMLAFLNESTGGHYDSAYPDVSKRLDAVADEIVAAYMGGADEIAMLLPSDAPRIRNEVMRSVGVLEGEDGETSYGALLSMQERPSRRKKPYPTPFSETPGESSIERALAEVSEAYSLMDAQMRDVYDRLDRVSKGIHTPEQKRAAAEMAQRIVALTLATERAKTRERVAQVRQVEREKAKQAQAKVRDEIAERKADEKKLKHRALVDAAGYIRGILKGHPKYQAKMLTALKDVAEATMNKPKKGDFDTMIAKKAAELIAQADDFAQKAVKDQAISDLRDAVNNIRRHGVHHFSPERKVQAKLMLGEFAFKRLSEDQAVLEAITELENDNTAEVEMDQIQEVRKIIPKLVKDMEVDEIRYLAFMLNRITQEQKTARKSLHDGRNSETTTAKATIIRMIQGRKKVDLDSDDPKKPEGWLRKYLGHTLPTHTIAYIIDGARENGFVSRYFFGNFRDGTERAYEVRGKVRQYLESKIPDIDRDSLQHDRRRHGVIPRRARMTTYNLDSGDKLTIDDAQKIALYLYSLNDDSMRHLTAERGGVLQPDNTDRASAIKLLPTDVARIVGDVLSDPNLKRIADAYHHVFNTITKEYLNKASMELHAEEIADVDDYIPMIVSRLHRYFQSMDNETMTPDDIRNMVHATIEGMGSLKRRMPSASAPLVLYDIFTLGERATKAASLYYGYARPLDLQKRLRRPLSEKQKGAAGSVEGAIRRAYGDTYWESLTSIARDYERVEAQSSIERAANRFLNMLTRGALAFNLPVVFVQPISYIATKPMMPLKYWMQGLASKPASWETMGKHNWTLYWRGQGRATIATGELSEEKHKAMGQLGMRGILWGDRQAVGRIWNAVYARMKDENPRLSDDAVRRMTGTRVVDILIRTQPTFEQETRSLAQRNKNVGIRSVMRFSSQRTTLHDMFARAIIDVKHGNISANRFAETVMLIIGSQIAVSALKTLAGAAYKRRDDDEHDEYFLRMLLTSLSTLGGRGLELLADAANMASYYGLKLQDPFMGILTDAVAAVSGGKRAAAQLLQGDTDKATKTAKRTLDRGIRTFGVASGTGAHNILEPVRALFQHAHALAGEKKGHAPRPAGRPIPRAVRRRPPPPRPQRRRAIPRPRTR